MSPASSLVKKYLGQGGTVFAVLLIGTNSLLANPGSSSQVETQCVPLVTEVEEACETSGVLSESMVTGTLEGLAATAGAGSTTESLGAATEAGKLKASAIKNAMAMCEKASSACVTGCEGYRQNEVAHLNRINTILSSGSSLGPGDAMSLQTERNERTLQLHTMNQQIGQCKVKKEENTVTLGARLKKLGGYLLILGPILAQLLEDGGGGGGGGNADIPDPVLISDPCRRNKNAVGCTKKTPKAKSGGGATTAGTGTGNGSTMGGDSMLGRPDGPEVPESSDDGNFISGAGAGNFGGGAGSGLLGSGGDFGSGSKVPYQEGGTGGLDTNLKKGYLTGSRASSGGSGEFSASSVGAGSSFKFKGASVKNGKKGATAKISKSLKNKYKVGKFAGANRRSPSSTNGPFEDNFRSVRKTYKEAKGTLSH